MSIHKIYGVMNQLENQSSKTTKEQILKNNEGNMEFREALNFLLNPYIVTGISTKKMNKEFNDDVTLRGFISDFKNLIEYLLRNNSGKDDNIRMIQSFIERQESDEIKEFVKKFVTKDLKLGISEKTVNKVYGKGTIPSFAVMLAESYAKKEDKVTGEFYVTLKLDGNRCIAIKENDKVKFFTRKGQPIEGMTELEEEFRYMGDSLVYDGELLLVNKDNLSSDKLFRATQKVVRKDGEKKDLIFNMFDCLPLEEFKSGKSKKTYEERREMLDVAVTMHYVARSGNYFESLKYIKILPVLYKGSDKSVIPTMMAEVEANGYEGLMVNTAKGLYQTKRVNDLLKVKTFKSADLLCIGLEEGTGRNEGRLGAVLVEYKGGTTKIGTGFSDEQRDYFWNNQDEINGKIIETKFFEESMDEKTQQVSLRFPVFICVRLDKDIEDIRYE